MVLSVYGIIFIMGSVNQLVGTIGYVTFIEIIDQKAHPTVLHDLDEERVVIFAQVIIQWLIFAYIYIYNIYNIYTHIFPSLSKTLYFLD